MEMDEKLKHHFELLGKHLLKIADALKIKLSELFNYKNYHEKQQ